MKEIKRKKKMSFNKKQLIVNIILILIVVMGNVAFAEGAVDTKKIDDLIKEVIVPWVQKIGLVIGFIGGIMFALGWRNDDADSKSRGLQTMISGFMVAGVATSYDLFVS